MPDLAVLVPVLNRPHRARPVLAAFQETVDAHILFICDHHDTAEREAVKEAGGEILILDGNYAQKIRAGVEATTEPLIFTGADDLEPKKGWFEEAKALLSTGTQVVGVNDLIPRRRDHQTHFLMTREYAELPTLDGWPGPFFDGYTSWFCDDELIATAKKRGAYAYAPKAIVEHLHPMAGKAPDDETYRIGFRNQQGDRFMFWRREALWT